MKITHKQIARNPKIVYTIKLGPKEAAVLAAAIGDVVVEDGLPQYMYPLYATLLKGNPYRFSAQITAWEGLGEVRVSGEV